MNSQPFSKALQHEKTINTRFGEITLECRQVSEIILPSGLIVACDPIHLYDLDPYHQRIPPGRYPVILYIAHVKTSADQRISSMTIRVRHEEPVRWKQARKVRSDVNYFERDNDIHGYGVDVGYGSLMDLEVAYLLQKRMSEDDRYHDVIFELAEENDPEWANIVLDTDTGLNFVVAQAGFGDGFYHSHWGYDASGNIACLMTDFGFWNNRC